MHQILKMRSFEGKKPVEVGFNDNIKIESLEDLLTKSTNILERFAEDDRFNLICTIAHVKNMKGRVFESQDIIPIDVDHVDSSMLKDVFHTICATLMVDPKKTGAISTGNGLHIFIKVTQWTNKKYFDDNRKAYKAMADILQDALKMQALQGVIDTNIFAPSMTTRVPGSVNDKTFKGGAKKNVTVLAKSLEFQSFDLSSFKSLADIRDEASKEYGRVDVPSVLECPFLMNCKENVAYIKEPEWFAMLGVLAFLPDGDKLCHEYSAGHPSYSFNDTEKKITQVMKMSGPRTCQNISALFGGCESCPHYQSITSPVQIKGDDFIETEHSGFHKQLLTKNQMVKLVPVPRDLVRFYERSNPFVVEPSGAVYSCRGEQRVWSMVSEVELNAFATQYYKPEANNNMRNEFRGELYAHNVVPNGYFNDTGRGLLNLVNGVLDMNTLELKEHNSDYRFMYKLDYEYDPEATCPIFDNAMKEIFCRDTDMISIFFEFLGLIISGIPNNRFEKALIMVGSGSNGKSTLIRAITDMVGQDNCANCTVDSLKNPQNAQNLRGKLANLVPEMESDDFGQSAYFKSLISGEPQTMKILYAQPFSEPIGAKFVMSCNTLPQTKDWTHGMLRRLLILPLHKKFSSSEDNFDRNINEKFKDERAGILNRAIEGYKRLIKNNEFSRSKVSEVAMNNYRETNDSVAQWFQDNAEVDYAYVTPVIEVYKSYTDYCNAINMRPLALSRFGIRIRDFDPKIQAERRVINGRRENNYRAVKLVGGNYAF